MSTVRLTRPFSVSTSARLPSSVLALQSPPSANASSVGAPSMAIFVTEPEAGSTREIRYGPEGVLATNQTAPWPTVTPVGPLPTAMVCDTAFAAGSIRSKRPDSSLVTDTDPSPAAMPLGLWRRRTVPTRRPVADEIRDSVASSSLTTQTAPCVKARPVGPFPTRVVATTVPWSGLISETVPSWPCSRPRPTPRRRRRPRERVPLRSCPR